MRIKLNQFYNEKIELKNACNIEFNILFLTMSNTHKYLKIYYNIINKKWWYIIYELTRIISNVIIKNIEFKQFNHAWFQWLIIK